MMVEEIRKTDVGTPVIKPQVTAVKPTEIALNPEQFEDPLVAADKFDNPIIARDDPTK